VVPKLSFRFTRNRDTCILGFDEDRSSRRLDCLPEVSGETLVGVSDMAAGVETLLLKVCLCASSR